MTSARIVTPGHATATIPTATARMPSRINEVEVDLNMRSVPFARSVAPRHCGSPWCLLTSGDAKALMPANTRRLWTYSCGLRDHSAGVTGIEGAEPSRAGGHVAVERDVLLLGVC